MTGVPKSRQTGNIFKENNITDRRIISKDGTAKLTIVQNRYIVTVRILSLPESLQ